jgi:hypothetical protein
VARGAIKGPRNIISQGIKSPSASSPDKCGGHGDEEESRKIALERRVRFGRSLNCALKSKGNRSGRGSGAPVPSSQPIKPRDTRSTPSDTHTHTHTRQSRAAPNHTYAFMGREAADKRPRKVNGRVGPRGGGWRCVDRVSLIELLREHRRATSPRVSPPGLSSRSSVFDAWVWLEACDGQESVNVLSRPSRSTRLINALPLRERA